MQSRLNFELSMTIFLKIKVLRQKKNMLKSTQTDINYGNQYNIILLKNVY